jgi:hydroxyacylglutathione hydrolase
MIIEKIYYQNQLKNINYLLLVNESLYIFDPFDAKIILERIQLIQSQENLIIKNYFLLLTHHHSDHVSGLSELEKSLNLNKINFEKETIFTIDENKSIQCYPTPGHTLDHCCFLIWDREYSLQCPWVIITGDFLFHGGVGNCKNGGDLSRHFQSVSQFPWSAWQNSVVLPSHDLLLKNFDFIQTVEPENRDLSYYHQKYLQAPDNFVSTIRDELRYNPFIRRDVLQNQKKFLKMSDEMIFMELRHLRDKF